MGSVITVNAGSEEVMREFIAAGFTAALNRGIASEAQVKAIGESIKTSESFAFQLDQELLPVFKDAFADMEKRSQNNEHTPSALRIIADLEKSK